MTCEEIREKISRMADQELSDEECALVTEHLAACPECMMVYEAFSALSDVLGELEDPPEGFTQSVMHKVRARARVPKLQRGLFRAAGLAACFALVLFTGRSAGFFPAQTPDAPVIRSAPSNQQTQTDSGTSLFSVASEPMEDADASLMDYSYASITPGDSRQPVASNALYFMETAADSAVDPVLLQDQLTADAPAEYGLFPPPADYTVTFYNADETGEGRELSVWLDGDQVYCQDELTRSAYYAVCTAEAFLAALEQP